MPKAILRGTRRASGWSSSTLSSQRSGISPTFPTRREKSAILTDAWRKSPLRDVGWGANGFAWRGDAWRGLRRRIELELVDKHFLFCGEVGVAAEDQCAAVGGREMHVEHLHGGELVEHRPGREAGGQRREPRAQRDVQAIGQEGDEDMRLDALLELMVDRAQLQIVLQGLEGCLDLDELDIEPPQLSRVLAAQIGAQQVAPFAPPHLAQLGAIERDAEGGTLRRHRALEEAQDRRCLGARGAELHE